MRESVARRIVFGLLGQIREGRLTLVEGARRHEFGAGAPAATIQVHSPALWPHLIHGGRGLAEAYAQGLWDSPDVTAVLRIAARNVNRLDAARRRLAPVREPYLRARQAFVRNTPRRSRKDIEAHYDLGDALFERMLDPTMMYSCALFERPGMTLEEASLAKLEQVCEKLELRHDDHVLEIGTGWGGFAVHAASTRGCRVTTTTISREQHDWAVEAVRRAGVEDLVTVLLEDYRDLSGSYDKLVSLEMIEAVGWRHFGTFFGRCSRLLAPDGLMLLQAITIEDPAYEAEKASRSFINKLIFPGGCLPSRELIDGRLPAAGLERVGLEDLTESYVLTLRHWRSRFRAAADEAARLGYDRRFRRLWELYLDYVEAGFAERRIEVGQLLISGPGYRNSRENLAVGPQRVIVAP